MPIKSIPAGKFKSQCLRLMDTVQRTRSPITITKRGKPVAKLVPVEQADDDWFDGLRGRMKIVGDIEAPIDPPEAWESSR